MKVNLIVFSLGLLFSIDSFSRPVAPESIHMIEGDRETKSVFDVKLYQDGQLKGKVLKYEHSFSSPVEESIHVRTDSEDREELLAMADRLVHASSIVHRPMVVCMAMPMPYMQSRLYLLQNGSLNFRTPIISTTGMCDGRPVYLAYERDKEVHRQFVQKVFELIKNK